MISTSELMKALAALARSLMTRKEPYCASVKIAKTTWILTLGLFIFGILIWGTFAGVILQRQTKQATAFPEIVRHVMLGVAAVELVAAILLFRRGATMRTMSYRSFHRRSMLACSLASGAALVGLLLTLAGQSFSHVLWLGCASVVVILVYILPNGLDYWATSQNVNQAVLPPPSTLTTPPPVRPPPVPPPLPPRLQ